MSGEGSSASARRDTVVRRPEGLGDLPGESQQQQRQEHDTSTHKGKGKATEPIRQLIMESTGSSSVPQMPAGMKLKGNENYGTWKNNMLNLAIGAGLASHYMPRKMYPKPREITDDNFESATAEECQAWMDWETRDKRALYALSVNITSGSQGVIRNCKTAQSAWNTLQAAFEDKGGMLIYQTMERLIQLKCDVQPSVEKYTIAFRECVSRLEGLEAPMPYIHVITLFVMGAAKSFPAWAERQRHQTLGSLSMNTPAAVLEDLITDLLDADRARNKTAKPSGSALLKGKGGKGKKCKHCHQEDPRHSEKD
ncbi:hypothetical protein OIDMADRAFT_59717 [Oidiodendron maius Zn]|uniref:Retrotransposon Copia-like N-terminal domain-containing protein n=1 Tax=Oidiodendron maius (strain Zn) TaxID=913774 RepID=A0A0C3GGG1_OIDMZ|nr:hypothetical protein OIDMADRAFT_59717 [Oidiodendron maius Zn]